ncbi:hypothetical protein FOC34_14555 [Burkholderia multivorans]|nr:hypothetical protein [Burkholderia multivorans]QGR86479.1 hypothetical protein FOC34_14555 [Burkholderia multivorans]
MIQITFFALKPRATTRAEVAYAPPTRQRAPDDGPQRTAAGMPTRRASPDRAGSIMFVPIGNRGAIVAILSSHTVFLTESSVFSLRCPESGSVLSYF